MPRGDLPSLWALSENLKKAVHILLAQAKFAHLRDMFHDRPHPDATRLHFALASFEDSILADVEQRCNDLSGVAINA